MKLFSQGIRIALVLAITITGPLARAGDAGASDSHGPPPAVTDWPAAESALIEAVAAYHTALTSGDLSAAGAYVVDGDGFVMLEGRHSNWGWADYRDHHLAGELDDLSQVRFRLGFYRVRIDGSLGYATFRFEVLPKEGPEMDFGKGFATAVLELTSSGWKLRHLHTS